MLGRPVLVFFTACICQFAQQVPALVPVSGKVLDAKKAPIAGATVSLKRGGSATRVVESDSNGLFAFPAVPAANYQLEILKSGFEIYLQPRLEVKAGLGPLEIDLAVETLVSSVTVESTLGRSTASRMDVPAADLPVSQNTVSAELIHRQGATDLVTALRSVSGMNAYTLYGPYEYYSFRGFNTENTVLVDGIRLEGNRINSQINNVEQVDVLKGPSSVLYGNDSVSGVINLVRKKPSAQKNYDYTLSGGRFRNIRLMGGATGRMFGKDSLLYRVDSAFQELGAFRDASSRRWNLTPAFTWLPSARHRFHTMVTYNRDRFKTDAGIPAAALDVPGARLDRRFNPPDDFEKSDDAQFQGQYNFILNDNLEFRNTFQYRYNEDQYWTAEFLTFRAPTTIQRGYLYFKHHRRPLINQSDATGRAKILGMQHRFNVGYEYQRYNNTTDRSANPTVASIDLLNPVETVGARNQFPITRFDNFTNQFNALYWQDQITVLPRLKVNIGGRTDFFERFSRNDPVVNGTPTLGTPFTRKITAFTYRAGAVFDATKWWSIYGNRATSFRPVTTVPIGGRQLNPETGEQWEIGQRFYLLQRRLTVTTALFDIKRKNVTYAIPTAPGDFTQAGQQSSRGVELDAEGVIGKGITALLNYGYADAQFDDFLQGTRQLAGLRPNFVARHTGSLWVTKAFDNGFGFSLGGRYRGNLFSDRLNSIRLGGFTTWDANLFYRRNKIEYSVNFMNILNKRRYFLSAINDNQLYPGAPINVFGTIRWRFR